MIKAKKVIEFIENKNNIKLLEYQKEIIDHIIRGDLIYTPRNAGRSMLYKGYADYLKEEIAPSIDYDLCPDDFDKVVTYKDVVQGGLLSQKHINASKAANPTLFAIEYNCYVEE